MTANEPPKFVIKMIQVKKISMNAGRRVNPMVSSRVVMASFPLSMMRNSDPPSRSADTCDDRLNTRVSCEMES